MITALALLIAGGLYCIGFAVFHLFFWRLFDWRNELTLLGPINRHVMPIMNWCLIVLFLLFAYCSLFHTQELLGTELGKSLLVGISFLWLFRAALQVVYFGLKNKVSLCLFVLFLLGFCLYSAPLVIVYS